MRPITARHGFAYDGDRRGALGIALRELAASLQRGSHGLEIGGRDDFVGRRRLLAGRGGRLAFGPEEDVIGPTLRSRGLNARHVLQPLQQGLKEERLLFRAGILVMGQGNIHCDDIGGVNAQVDIH